MVNFKSLIGELKNLNGTEVVVSTIGKINGVFGLEKCLVMEYENGLQICNINNVLDENNAISFVVDENGIANYEVTEVDSNLEVKIDLENGECMIIMGCNA